MALITTDAFLLKKINFRDSSNIIHFYTREQGKISVIAKGARQLKSQFRGYLEPLNLLTIIYYEKDTREIQTLSKVDLKKNYLSKQKDMVAVSYGMAILETLDKMVHHNEENEQLFGITVNILNFLDSNYKEAETAYILFLLGAIKLLGYHVDFSACHMCGAELFSFHFDRNHPQPLCPDCSAKNADFVTGGQLAWLRKADNLDLQKPILTKLSAPNSAIISDFLLNYAGMHFDFLPTLHSLELIKYFK